MLRLCLHSSMLHFPRNFLRNYTWNLGKNQNGAVKEAKDNDRGLTWTHKETLALILVWSDTEIQDEADYNSTCISENGKTTESVWLRKNCHPMLQTDGWFSRESFSCSEVNGFLAMCKQTSGFAPDYLMLLSHLGEYPCEYENLRQNRRKWYDWSGKILKKVRPYECHPNANKQPRILANPLQIKRMGCDIFENACERLANTCEYLQMLENDIQTIRLSCKWLAHSTQVVSLG